MKVKQGDQVAFEYDGKQVQGYVESVDKDGWPKIVEGPTGVGEVYYMPPQSVRVVSSL